MAERQPYRVDVTLKRTRITAAYELEREHLDRECSSTPHHFGEFELEFLDSYSSVHVL
jgi:hypothetical protein